MKMDRGKQNANVGMHLPISRHGSMKFFYQDDSEPSAFSKAGKCLADGSIMAL
jgi:hypothetical protein